MVWSMQVNLRERGELEQAKDAERPAKRADGAAGKGWWKKRRPSCNEADKGVAPPIRATSPHAEVGRLPPGLSSRENLANCHREGKKMRAGYGLAGAPFSGVNPRGSSRCVS